MKPKKKVICLSRVNLKNLIAKENWSSPPENCAVIQICCTKICQKFVLKSKEDFFFTPNDNVLNLTFDDIGSRFKLDGFKLYQGLSNQQARKIVKFIDKNKDKDFYISCRAGKSRSQGIVRFILDIFRNAFDCITNPDNPCLTPNSYVSSLLFRAYRKLGLDIKDIIQNNTGKKVLYYGWNRTHKRYYFILDSDSILYFLPNKQPYDRQFLLVKRMAGKLDDLIKQV